MKVGSAAFPDRGTGGGRHRPVKVLDLRDSPWLDGPGRTILQCAAMVERHRCSISVGAFCPASPADHDYLQSARSLGLPVIPITENRSLDIGVLKQILRAIRTETIDIVHAHDFRSNVFALLAAKRSGIPAVTTCHGWIANSVKGKLRCRLDQGLLRWFDRVIAVSGHMAQTLPRFGVPQKRTTVIVNALVVEDYQPGRDGTLRQEWEVPTDAFLVGNIGRLSPEKGQDLLLRAVQQLVVRKPRIHLVFIGIGPQESLLRSMSRELGIEDRVCFAGFQKDMARVYRNLDLVVQSSHTEGMPNVVLEAMLMEVPVVATNVGGTAEIVQPVCEDFLIEPGTVEALVGGIERVMADRGRYEEKARRGRRYVAEHFNQQRRVELLMQVYEEVLAQRSGTSGR